MLNKSLLNSKTVAFALILNLGAAVMVTRRGLIMNGDCCGEGVELARIARC